MKLELERLRLGGRREGAKERRGDRELRGREVHAQESLKSGDASGKPEPGGRRRLRSVWDSEHQRVRAAPRLVQLHACARGARVHRNFTRAYARGARVTARRGTAAARLGRAVQVPGPIRAGSDPSLPLNRRRSAGHIMASKTGSTRYYGRAAGQAGAVRTSELRTARRFAAPERPGDHLVPRPAQPGPGLRPQGPGRSPCGAGRGRAMVCGGPPGTVRDAPRPTCRGAAAALAAPQ